MTVYTKIYPNFRWLVNEAKLTTPDLLELYRKQNHIVPHGTMYNHYRRASGALQAKWGIPKSIEITAAKLRKTAQEDQAGNSTASVVSVGPEVEGPTQLEMELGKLDIETKDPQPAPVLTPTPPKPFNGYLSLDVQEDRVFTTEDLMLVIKAVVGTERIKSVRIEF